MLWENPHAIKLARPFRGEGKNELVKQPKVYAFDTDFVSFAHGWDPLRQEDMGILREYLVLEQLQAHFPDMPVRFWRAKQGREMDFVLAQSRDHVDVDVVECKWNSGTFDPAALDTFRTYYPKGRNYLVSPSRSPGYTKMFGPHEMRVCAFPGQRQSASSRSAADPLSAGRFDALQEPAFNPELPVILFAGRR